MLATLYTVDIYPRTYIFVDGGDKIHGLTREVFYRH
jgi:hypothetical protein